MKHLELFSGIGGFRRAMDLLTKDGIMDFECIGFSEIEQKAVDTYCTNFPVSMSEKALGDIVFFTADKRNIDCLPDFDLLTGGFPCQTFSVMGKQKGFDEDRGQMFFRIMDILEVKLPTYVLLENVKNLYTHDNGNTFKVIVNELSRLGYNVFYNIFNTKDFGLPQKRSRTIIFATRNEVPINMHELFTAEEIKKYFETVIDTRSVYHFTSTLQILDKQVDQKYFLSERIKPTLLSNGSANFVAKSDINQEIARTLTASMHKMHRACQDNYYSQDFIDSDGAINHVLDWTKEQLATLDIRKITPEEAFQMQGFPKEFATKARNYGINDAALYKQAGNAVSVNTIYAILDYLITKQILK